MTAVSLPLSTQTADMRRFKTIAAFIAKSVLRAVWRDLKALAGIIGWIVLLILLAPVARKYGCVEGEPLVLCARQWQSLIAAAIAFLIASVTWKLTIASQKQAVNLFFAGQREKVGDKYEEDLRELALFRTEFFECHYDIDRHLDDRKLKPRPHVIERLNRLRFPTWPDAGTDHYYNSCLHEYKDHYAAALKSRDTKPDDFTEHGIRCQGIFKWLTNNLDDVKRKRKELYEADLARLR